jgi:lysophospholipase
VAANPEIGHVDHFESYTRDLGTFLAQVVKPRLPAGQKLFLLAHSMGGGIAADYLSNSEQYGGVSIDLAVLSAPMLQINTKPYPEAVGRAIVAGERAIGKGEEYAPGKTDYDPNAPFEKNDVTQSEARWWMTNEMIREFPRTAMGGPSNQWVDEALGATHRIRRAMKRATTPILMFQAGHDLLVDPGGQEKGCARASKCKIIVFPESEHEILNERDFIRDRAFDLIDDFFSGGWNY